MSITAGLTNMLNITGCTVFASKLISNDLSTAGDANFAGTVNLAGITNIAGVVQMVGNNVILGNTQFDGIITVPTQNVNDNSSKIATTEYTDRAVNNIIDSKTFVIDHPIDKTKYLVHACLEGPEAGVYYRGKGEINNNNNYVDICLPYYVEQLATDFTIQITPIGSNIVNIYSVSEVENNKFTVFGKNGRFFWHVYGKRIDIMVEPTKDSVVLNGNGPYKWISS